ncbi:hypothetical protein [Halococcus sp. PRR34]|uniref:hypothetical protein n=1 Tax=Halococcus sp. PRR34 TaxID=3020830 RepID=UPI00235E1AE5|nr:hypothetical protein [Halococcus sp. PRR34]
MAPDFTNFLLGILYNEWGTGETSPPSNVVFINRRNTTRMSQNEPDAAANLSAHNAIGVGAGPTTDNEATGFDFDYRYDGGADVRIRGKLASEGGHIADDEEWSALCGEARRIINSHRRHPITRPGIGGAYTLMIRNENDLSQNYQEQYHLNFDVMFDGIEVLP